MKTKKNKKIIATLFVVILNALWVNAQTVQWTNHYQTTGIDDVPSDVHIGGDGRIYICGAKGISSTDQEAMVISYSISGTQNWISTYSGSAGTWDYFNAMTSYGTGTNIAIYATGLAVTLASGDDMLLVKYNQSGAQQWAVTLNNTGFSTEQANCITVDGSGNVYICGKTSTNGGDLFVAKYNSSGVLQWSTPYNSSGTQEDAPQHMKINSAGTYLYITSVRTISANDHNAVLQQISASTGAISWTSVYDNTLTNDIDETYWVDIDNTGNIYTAGETQTASNGLDALILKYNTSGTLLSTYTWNNSSTNLNDAFSSIHIVYPTHTNQIYVTGYTQINTGTNDSDFLTIKYSGTSTTPVWTSTYDGAGNGCPTANDDYGYMILADPGSGKVVVTGRSYETAASLNWTTIQYNSTTGAQVWIDSYDRNAKDNTPYYKYPLALQHDGCTGDVDFYVTGYTKESSSSNITDATTRRYGYTGNCAKMAVTGIGENDGNDHINLKLFPNPANESVIVECSQENVSASFVIYDVTGRQVKVIDNISTQKFEVNLYELEAGIYHYTLIEGHSLISTGKLVKEN